jgi:PmbA protein
MEKLLELAASAADQAEVYSLDQRHEAVEFRDAKLHDTKTELRSGVCLRILAGGRLGFAWTRNLVDRQALLDDALASLSGGVEAGFDLPATPAPPALDNYDPAAEGVTTEALLEQGGLVVEELADRTGGEVQVDAGIAVHSFRIANTRGADLSATTSTYHVRFSVSVPGTGARISRIFRAPAVAPFPEELIDEAVWLYAPCERDASPEGGRMKVLFMPNSLYTLTWRLKSGASARSVFEGISPIAERVGERVLSEKITLLDDPRDTAVPQARPFDDEGVACDRFPIFERGVLRGFFTNLDYAAKLGLAPTGHGYRRVMIGSEDPVTRLPVPELAGVTFEPGTSSLRDLVGGMDRGLILEHVLGAHSGNIPNGDYAVGVAPALYVEGGEIVGRVKDAMVSGNVYETLSDVVAVGDTKREEFEARKPPVLCDGVSVACR